MFWGKGVLNLENGKRLAKRKTEALLKYLPCYVRLLYKWMFSAAFKSQWQLSLPAHFTNPQRRHDPNCVECAVPCRIVPCRLTPLI